MELIINDRIRIRRIDFFNEIKVDLKFDSVASTFSVKFYFDPRNKEHAELACISHFHEAWIEHNGERLLTGYIISNAFNSSPKRELVEIGGYSKPGIIEDCDIPPGGNWSFNNLSLNQITQKILSIFKGIKLKVDSSASGSNLVFTNIADPIIDDNGNYQENDNDVSASESESLEDGVNQDMGIIQVKPDQNIKSFLTDLATQRNILLSHDEYGNLLFTQAKTNQPPVIYFDYTKGLKPATSMHLSFNGQAIHSHITIVGQANLDTDNASEFTIQNPFCPILYRPKVIKQTSGTHITIQEAARQALAAELKSITLTITLDRWDIDGKLLRPNSIINVFNPECYIYKPTNFFIESISYEGDSKKQNATLTCVLPEVYNKAAVKNIFVDPHQNLPRF